MRISNWSSDVCSSDLFPRRSSDSSVSDHQSVLLATFQFRFLHHTFSCSQPSYKAQADDPPKESTSHPTASAFLLVVSSCFTLSNRTPHTVRWPSFQLGVPSHFNESCEIERPSCRERGFP